MSRNHAVLVPALAFALLLASIVAAQQQHEIEMRGVYATIDMTLSQQTVKKLAGGSDAERAAAIEAIEASPSKYIPAVFYGLAITLLNEGRQDDAVFWFHFGRLRARFDAGRCADVSARQLPAALDQSAGSPIFAHIAQNLEKYATTVDEVVALDRKTPHDYDHRWINLHGLDATIYSLDEDAEAKPLSLPEEDWDEIEERTRREYLEEYREALESLREAG